MDTGWRGLREVLRRLKEGNVTVYAANAGYFLVLSLFPTLVLLMGLLRYTGIAVQTLTDALTGFVPQALLPAARRLILTTYQSTSGATVSISAVTALWSASRGVYGLICGLNAVYRVRESRGYFHTRAVSAAYTVLLLLVLVGTLVLRVFGNGLAAALPALNIGLLLPMVQTGLFTGMFMVLPNQKNRLLDSLPGAVLASLGWLGFSELYSVYVEHFAGYSGIYGSVYTVALSMLWLYCCLSILFYGGALNRYLQEKRK